VAKHATTQGKQQEVELMANSYTTEQILEKVAKRIDYKELVRILEYDLNYISNTT
jgi:hypothetical protein